MLRNADHRVSFVCGDNVVGLSIWRLAAGADPGRKMPHSFGYRARTRSMFSKAFGTHGVTPLGTYMTEYKVSIAIHA